MNIYELRQSVIVTLFGSFWNGQDNARIMYNIDGRPQPKIELQPDELKKELIAIGSIEDDISDDDLRQYHISQWDALSLAIRYELAKETEKELRDSDIFEALAKITKPNI